MASIINATVTSPGGLVTTGDNTNELKIQTGETDAVTVNSSQVVTFNNPIVVGTNAINAENSLGFRNRIINGDMRIDQRNAGAAVTADGAYPLDRFIMTNVTDGAFSASRSTTVPAGFNNSLYFTTTTADGSLSATQRCHLRQTIEGFNSADLGWGTANAKTVTLSFWVRSSLTGTFGGALSNGSVNRSYPFTYAISVADTWEYKTITIAGDTSGTWATDNGSGINLIFGLGVGSTYSGTAGAWAGADYRSATGATSVIGTLNATWYVTGVQLEVGSVATPFERLDYGRQLIQCQRYYYKVFPNASTASISTGGWAINTTVARAMHPFLVEMRVAPTALEQSGTASDYKVAYAGTAANCSSVPTFSNASKNIAASNFTVASGLTAGNAIGIESNSTAAYLAWSAEL